MVSRLGKQFFDTFGISPKSRFRGCKLGVKYYAEICDEQTCIGCDEEIRKTEYPQITDRILLELICLLNKYSFLDLWGEDIKELKGEVLDNCITIALDGSLDEATQELKRYKQQVQALFKEK